jgi:hypothetical protein
MFSSTLSLTRIIAGITGDSNAGMDRSMAIRNEKGHNELERNLENVDRKQNHHEVYL